MRARRTCKTIELTVEKSESFNIRRPLRLIFAWCDTCGARVRLLTPEAAAVASDVSPRAIYRQVETERVHFTETPEGLLLICLKSLTETMSAER